MKAFSLGIPLVVLFVAPAASAQRASDVDVTEPLRSTSTVVSVAAPHRAFELSPSVGYTQGFGNVRSGQSMPTVATTGGTLGVAAGYRTNPAWALSFSAAYQEYSPARVLGVRGAVFSLAATRHFAPFSSADPWLEVGSGYRFLWTDAGTGVTTDHGFQLARLTAGLDLDIANDIRLGPAGGLELDLFAYEEGDAIAARRLSVFAFAGMVGRFDFGGIRQEREIPQVEEELARGDAR